MLRGSSCPAPLTGPGPLRGGDAISAHGPVDSGSAASLRPRPAPAARAAAAAGPLGDLPRPPTARAARSHRRLPIARSAPAQPWHDDGEAPQAEQDTRRRPRPGRARARSAAEPPGASAAPPARTTGPGAGSRRGSRRPPCAAVPSISFSATFPVKPSVTTTSAAPRDRPVPSLDVAGELDCRAPPQRRRPSRASTTPAPTRAGTSSKS